MARTFSRCGNDLNESGFKVYHELMTHRIREILLVHTPYDAFIMEGDGTLASKIINEYRGLNLSKPPRMTLAPSGAEALSFLRKKQFDLVLTMPQVADMDAFALSRKIKRLDPHLPIILLAHEGSSLLPSEGSPAWRDIDNFYIWTADPDLLLSLVKNVEDHQNAARDTHTANVRVLLLVEDSPHYRSFFLPRLYKEIVRQTQAVLDESMNEEHRLLKMRARPKILTAADYTTALALYHRFRPYLFGVIADTRFPKRGKLNDQAGISLLSHIRKEIPDLPLLLLSADSGHRHQAGAIPSVFIDKNCPDLAEQLHRFFLDHLGFGDFVFRTPDGSEIDRACNLVSFAKKISTIGAESLFYHAANNHFSNWVFARGEVTLGNRLSKHCLDIAQGSEAIRKQVRSTVRETLIHRQQGVISLFNEKAYDPEIMHFAKIGQGAMGGKAMGLAFMADQLKKEFLLAQSGPVRIGFPTTVVITTDGFHAFIAVNRLPEPDEKQTDPEIKASFQAASLPDWLSRQLGCFIEHVRSPLVVRSSSIVEDAHSTPYAGLFSTIFLANSHPDTRVRLRHLEDAVKEVYASSFFAGPRAFAHSLGQEQQSRAMAVLLQQVVGHQYGNFYYPAISGVMQSRNWYPISPMQAEDGIAAIALGIGKSVVEGEKCLLFCPKYPQTLPQFSSVDDMLATSQTHFYAIRTREATEHPNLGANNTLIRRSLSEAVDEYPATILTSSYSPGEHQIRDIALPGPRLLTFAQALKYDLFPFAETLEQLIAIAKKGMGCAVEMEFAVDLGSGDQTPFFAILQLRPMVDGQQRTDLTISTKEKNKAVIHTTQVLGHGKEKTIADLVLVNPATFDRGNTRQIAGEIARMNATLLKESRPYLLIGPGRWGSNDPWLGIPVKWQDISGARAMVELRNKHLRADPSQGTHFFHNITSMGVYYLTVDEDGEHFIDWRWLLQQERQHQTPHLLHLRMPQPIILKVDGRAGCGVMLTDEQDNRKR